MKRRSREIREPMPSEKAWLAFNHWLIMNVGSVEAEEAKRLVGELLRAHFARLEAKLKEARE